MSDKKVFDQEKLFTAVKLDEQLAKSPLSSTQAELKATDMSVSESMATKLSEQYDIPSTSSIREQLLKPSDLSESASMAAKLSEQCAIPQTNSIQEQLLNASKLAESVSKAAKLSEQYAIPQTNSIQEQLLKASKLGESASVAAKFASLHNDIEKQRNSYLNMFSTKAPEVTLPERSFVNVNSHFIEQQAEIQKEKEEKKERELKQFELFENMHNTQCQIIELAKSSSSESAKERKVARIITFISLIIALVALIPPYLEIFSEKPPSVKTDKVEKKVEATALPVQAEIDANELKALPVK